MAGQTIQLHDSWLDVLSGEFEKPYMKELKRFLQQQKRDGKVVYPEGKDIFNALNSTPFDKVKVVILGQDPYHGPGQAHGLCFSVQKGVRFPPSLQNIFKEIQQEFNFPSPSHGCLQSWAAQGVLLLNATLTVEQGQAGSHQGKGWETFTDAVVAALNEKCEGLAFVLWGSYAQKKGAYIDPQKHCIFKSVHPSPLSAHRGFFGNGHFTKVNDYLAQQGKGAIDWSLPD